MINLILFLAVLLSTPGPATLAIAGHSTEFGWRKTLLFALGIGVSFVLVFTVCLLGYADFFIKYHYIKTALFVFSFFYFIYLSYRIITSAISPSAKSKPLRFYNGLLVHLPNLKAYITSVAVVTQFAPSLHMPMLTYILTGFTMSLFGGGIWVFFGTYLRKLVSSRRGKIILNIIIVTLLWACLLWALFSNSI